MSSNVTLSTEVELEKFNAVSASDSVSRYGRYWELIFGTLFFVAAVIGYAAYQSGSLERALPYLTGQRFFVSETQIDLGKVRCQAEVDASIHLINLSSNPVSIVGAKKSCKCIALDSFPFDVAAGSVLPMQLKIKAPDVAANFSHSVELYVAEPSFSSFQVIMSGMATKE